MSSVFSIDGSLLFFVIKEEFLISLLEGSCYLIVYFRCIKSLLFNNKFPWETWREKNPPLL